MSTRNFGSEKYGDKEGEGYSEYRKNSTCFLINCSVNGENNEE